MAEWKTVERHHKKDKKKDWKAACERGDHLWDGHCSQSFIDGEGKKCTFEMFPCVHCAMCQIFRCYRDDRSVIYWYDDTDPYTFSWTYDGRNK